MKWNVPNTITMCRIAASIILFALIGAYDHAASWATTLMGVAFVVFVLTALSDVLDGYLARKLGQVTAFGRIADPFVDKLLILGSLILLSGPAFTTTDETVLARFSGDLPRWLYGSSITGVQPWMVLIIFARELMVSTIRGYSESQGIAFPAIPVGKAKMLVQSFATGTVLFCIAWAEGIAWCNTVKLLIVWIAVAVTVFSGIIYVVKAKVFYREPGNTTGESGTGSDE